MRSRNLMASLRLVMLLTVRRARLRTAPPHPGERSGDFSSWDRGAKYNPQTKQYERWHATADEAGFIRREGPPDHRQRRCQTADVQRQGRASVDWHPCTAAAFPCQMASRRVCRCGPAVVHTRRPLARLAVAGGRRPRPVRRREPVPSPFLCRIRVERKTP